MGQGQELSRAQSRSSPARTDLRSLKLVKLLLRAEQALHGLDVLLLLEARKGGEVVDGLCEDLGLLEVLAIVATLCDQGVDDEVGLGEGQGVDALELAELDVIGSLLLAWGCRLGSGGRLATWSRLLVHDGGGSTVVKGKRKVGGGAERKEGAVTLAEMYPKLSIILDSGVVVGLDGIDCRRFA